MWGCVFCRHTVEQNENHYLSSSPRQSGSHDPTLAIHPFRKLPSVPTRRLPISKYSDVLKAGCQGFWLLDFPQTPNSKPVAQQADGAKTVSPAYGGFKFRSIFVIWQILVQLKVAEAFAICIQRALRAWIFRFTSGITGQLTSSLDTLRRVMRTSRSFGESLGTLLESSPFLWRSESSLCL